MEHQQVDGLVGTQLVGICLEVVVGNLSLDVTSNTFRRGSQEEVLSYLQSLNGRLDVGECGCTALFVDQLAHLLGGSGVLGDDNEILHTLGQQCVQLVQLGGNVTVTIHNTQIHIVCIGKLLQVICIVTDEGFVQVANQRTHYDLSVTL